ncbi:MAG TPA: hypothetical protein VGR38_10485 [Candidatus Polarisedimenticolia bacterium]|nr:hypothetical protein [Candidatus Polarisedimenticolia bacterium]
MHPAKAGLAVLQTAALLAFFSASAPQARMSGLDEPEAQERDLPTSDVTKCDMKFELKGWSAFYKTAKGTGTITCSNGQKASVNVKSTGGGITFGKSEILNGIGHFSGARNIEELFGSYVQSEAHVGAGKSSSAQAMTKGEVSLALKGTGRGVDLGFAFGKFTIEKAR